MLPIERNLDLPAAVAFLNVMSNTRRLIVLTILRQGEVTVGSLAGLVGLSQAALSQHLAKLRAAKLVRTRREAQTIYYSCHSEAVVRLLGLLDELFPDELIGEVRRRA